MTSHNTVLTVTPSTTCSSRPGGNPEYELMMSDETIWHIVDVITTCLSPRRIILFGSYAQREAGPDSDLDLFIELDPPLPARGRSSLVKRLFDPYPGPMDIVVYSPEEAAYCKRAPASVVASVLREGTVLYEQDG